MDSVITNTVIVLFSRFGMLLCALMVIALVYANLFLAPMLFGDPAARPRGRRLAGDDAMAMAWPDVAWEEMPLSDDERAQVEGRLRSVCSEFAGIDATI